MFFFLSQFFPFPLLPFSLLTSHLDDNHRFLLIGDTDRPLFPHFSRVPPLPPRIFLPARNYSFLILAGKVPSPDIRVPPLGLELVPVDEE